MDTSRDTAGATEGVMNISSALRRVNRRLCKRCLHPAGNHAGHKCYSVGHDGRCKCSGLIVAFGYLGGANLANAYLGNVDGKPAKVSGRWSSGNESGYNWFAAQCDCGVVVRYGCEMLLLETWRERLPDLIRKHEPYRVELFSRVLPALLDYIERSLGAECEPVMPVGGNW